MHIYAPFIVIGLANGSAYALLAVGLVLSYRTSGIFNFAHGGIAMVVAYSYYTLSVNEHLSTPIAVLISVAVIGPIVGIILDTLVFRRLSGGRVAPQVVLTVGLLVLLQSLAVILYGGVTKQIKPILPSSTIRLASVNVGWDQIIIVVVVPVLVLVLRTFYQVTMLGLNTRALVDNPELAKLEGIRTRVVTATSWAIGCAFAGLAGVLLAPSVGIDSTGIPLLVLQAFGAAAIGRLVSLPWAYSGALLLGVLASLSTKWAATIPALVGLPGSIPFIGLFVVLILTWRPGTALDQTVRIVKRPDPMITGRSLRAGGWLIALVILALAPPALGGSWLLAASAGAGYAIILSSLYLLTGLSRQVSLCHAVFAAIGVVVVAHLTEDGVPYFITLIAAMAVAAAVAAAVSIPAIRLSGLYLALATFAFGLLVEQLVWPMSIGFGAGGQLHVPRPEIFSGDRSYYWMILGAATLTIGGIGLVARRRLGLYTQALADSELGLQSIGIRPYSIRVATFCLSAAVAGLGGALLGSLYGTIIPGQFNYSQSLLFIAVLVTAGLVGQSGVALASVLLIVIPTVFTWSWISKWSGVVFGLNAIIYANSPEGIIGAWRRARSHLLRLLDRRALSPSMWLAANESRG